MSIVAVLVFVLFCTYLMSSFGGRVHARNATTWWMVMLFLFVGVVHPESYSYLASLLGVQLVSNFVLGVMILFLVNNSMQNASDSTRALRQVREMCSSDAANRFCSKVAAGSLTGKTTRVLVVLPTYNEQGNIQGMRDAYDRCFSTPVGDISYTFCFVNDASCDDTELELAQLWPDNYVSHYVNCGVSGVLMTGFKIGKMLDADFVVQCDSDGQHPVGGISALVEAALSYGSDITVGSRFVEKTADHNVLESTSRIRRAGGIFISFLLRVLFPVGRISDPTSGFRVYSKAATKLLLRHMPDDYPEPESLAICSHAGLKVKEVPVRMEERQMGESSISGLKSFEFMVKVSTSLLAIRVRKLLLIDR